MVTFSRFFTTTLSTLKPEVPVIRKELIAFINYMCEGEYPGGKVRRGQWLSINGNRHLEVGVGCMSGQNAIATNAFHIEVHGQDLAFFDKVNRNKYGDYSEINETNKQDEILANLDKSLPNNWRKVSNPEGLSSAKNKM